MQDAPGKISTTADGWTADNSKASFLGVTAHWMDIKDGKWSLRSEVIGFKGVSGQHSGANLGRYFIGLCDRVGICNKERSKVRNSIDISMIGKTIDQLHTVTLDNTSNNNMLCETIEYLHTQRKYSPWRAAQNQLP
jgi:hypothetical protein